MSPLKEKYLSRNYIESKLRSYFGSELPSGAVESDYRMVQGPLPGLVCAEPMLPGNHAFYSWIANYGGYYLPARWEFKYVARDVLPNRKVARVADIGCGDGKFLEYIRNTRSAEVFGLDTLPESIAECGRKGINAYCGSIDRALEEDPGLAGTFDIVTSFHCLEHVPNPVDFLLHLRRLLKRDGIICVSTPHSPMPFEHAWYDPLNHPPHHLSQWNVAAYRSAAAQMDMNLQLVTPRNGSLLAWIWRTYRIRITDTPFRKPAVSDFRAIIRETIRLPYTAYQTFNGQRKVEVKGCDAVLALFSW